MATLRDADDAVIAALKSKLQNCSTSLPEKYRILFSLRNLKGPAAHDALQTALQDDSALFRHDVAFCMGQRQDPSAIEQLKQILHDPNEHPMVRHEAGEALGAIGTEECLQPVREHVEDNVQEVAETCQLALQRIQHMQQQQQAAAAAAAAATSTDESPYMSVDPTPALPASTPISELREILLDESRRMFDRYSALFALRNKGGPEVVQVLGEVFRCSSALLKHEVAYVLGQMQDPTSVDTLIRVLQDGREHAMVRHEAAEALGAIADDQSVELLNQFAKDSEPIVAHSCIVALDMIEFEKSGGFEYADTGVSAA